MNYFLSPKSYLLLLILFIFSLGCFLQCKEKAPVCLEPIPSEVVVLTEESKQEQSNSENCNTVYISNKKYISGIKDTQFATFYADYLLNLYCIKINHNINDSNNTDKQKEKLILNKFGDDFFNRSQEEAKKIYTMDITEKYGELDPELLEMYKQRRKE